MADHHSLMYLYPSSCFSNLPVFDSGCIISPLAGLGISRKDTYPKTMI